MFDFMKDLYLEACGLDLEQVRKERKEKLEIEKAETAIISKKAKKNVIVIGIIFLLIHLMSLTMSFAVKDSVSMIKSAIMIFLTLITMVCFAVRSKAAEFFGILLSAIIVALSFIIPQI